MKCVREREEVADLLSRPARGAWIEMLAVELRTPSYDVAPRTGRVD